ncbi:MAG: hypothetical protein HN548_04160 [Opitutae bacterium]|nr:hypothetical protein [Opitutae bacterium]MBT5717603.1 hypothetical protein [Opitutae bacterium]
MNTLSDKELLELHELLDALVEGNLSKDKIAQLEQWIGENEDVRMHYIEFMDMSSSLCHYADELISDDTDEFLDESSNSIPFWKPILSIAAVIVMGFFFLQDFKLIKEDPSALQIVDNSSSDTSKPVFSDNIILDSVAVLTKSVGVIWNESTNFRPNLGDTLESCDLKLSNGLAQVEFLQGATVVLEGPVDFSIINPNEGSLTAGKLRAIVPEVATGFTINVPKGRVIDLGTDFGLHVHAGGSTELFVYKGNVVYEGNTDSGENITREVSGGESIFVDPYGNANWVEMPTEPFISAADLAFRSMEESQRRHAAWVDLSNSISSDPKTLLYFSFDNHSPWSRILRNESKSERSFQNGAIVGCNWSEGRWSGKGALTFKRQNDRVRLHLPTHLKSATFSAWVKIDSLGQSISPIVCSDPSTLGSTCWSVNSNGQIVLRTRLEKGNVYYESAVAFRSEKLGKWAHIATTYDSEAKMVSHYVNGRSFSREKLVEPMVLRFPKAMLGHSSSLPKKKNGIAFKGSIDEFGIFEGVYGEDQIRKMYEIGRPFQVPNVLSSRIP